MSHRGLWEYDNETHFTLDEIEHITGSRPPECPWRAFTVPIVQSVIGLHRSAGGTTKDGPIATRALALDPPHAEWQGLNHYILARALVRASDERAREDAERGRQARGFTTGREKRRRLRG